MMGKDRKICFPAHIQFVIKRTNGSRLCTNNTCDHDAPEFGLEDPACVIFNVSNKKDHESLRLLKIHFVSCASHAQKCSRELVEVGVGPQVESVLLHWDSARCHTGAFLSQSFSPNRAGFMKEIRDFQSRIPVFFTLVHLVDKTDAQ